jgi:hypothetical protein
MVIIIIIIIYQSLHHYRGDLMYVGDDPIGNRVSSLSFSKSRNEVKGSQLLPSLPPNNNHPNILSSHYYHHQSSSPHVLTQNWSQPHPQQQQQQQQARYAQQAPSRPTPSTNNMPQFQVARANAPQSTIPSMQMDAAGSSPPLRVASQGLFGQRLLSMNNNNNNEGVYYGQERHHRSIHELSQAGAKVNQRHHHHHHHHHHQQHEQINENSDRKRNTPMSVRGSRVESLPNNLSSNDMKTNHSGHSLHDTSNGMRQQLNHTSGGKPTSNEGHHRRRSRSNRQVVAVKHSAGATPISPSINNASDEAKKIAAGQSMPPPKPRMRKRPPLSVSVSSPPTLPQSNSSINPNNTIPINSLSTSSSQSRVSSTLSSPSPASESPPLLISTDSFSSSPLSLASSSPSLGQQKDGNIITSSMNQPSVPLPSMPRSPASSSSPNRYFSRGPMPILSPKPRYSVGFSSLLSSSPSAMSTSSTATTSPVPFPSSLSFAFSLQQQQQQLQQHHQQQHHHAPMSRPSSTHHSHKGNRAKGRSNVIHLASTVS